MLKMMNLSTTGDHKICGSTSIGSKVLAAADRARSRRSEGGYTLVALLAMMTVVALFAMAAAPSIQQQAQREREKEAIFRGEQVADAIRVYYVSRRASFGAAGDQALPRSMDDLLQGIPIPGGSKTRQILRASAARDPLTIEGEWRFILPRSNALIDFQQSLLFYAGGVLPPPRGEMAQLQQLAVPQIIATNTMGAVTSSSSSSSIDDDASGPFVGVASRSRRDSVLTYYGIEREDQWIFTPLFRQ
jgi:type II secretory pathway pseudopilin PulG